MARYWVDGKGGCPIGGPFDLWRSNYYRENGEPPEDTTKMYPGLDAATIKEVAVAAVATDVTLDDVLNALGDRGPAEQLEMAYAYFREWRKRAPFMPDSWQDAPLRPARTSPEPLEESLENWEARSAE